MSIHKSINEVYRYDINALRAIAVVAVILFHLWPDMLPGGYKGVDVFLLSLAF